MGKDSLSDLIVGLLAVDVRGDIWRVQQAFEGRIPVVLLYKEVDQGIKRVAYLGDLGSRKAFPGPMFTLMADAEKHAKEVIEAGYNEDP